MSGEPDFTGIFLVYHRLQILQMVLKNDICKFFLASV